MAQVSIMQVQGLVWRLCVVILRQVVMEPVQHQHVQQSVQIINILMRGQAVVLRALQIRGMEIAVQRHQHTLGRQVVR